MFFLAPASPTPLSPLYHKASSSPVHRSPCIAFCYTATAVQIRTKPFSIDQKQVDTNLSLILYFFARTCSPLLLGTCLHPELKIIRTHIIKGCYLIVMTFFLMTCIPHPVLSSAKHQLAGSSWLPVPWSTQWLLCALPGTHHQILDDWPCRHTR